MFQTHAHLRMAFATKHTKYVQWTSNISLHRSSEASDVERKCFQCYDFARYFANCTKSIFAPFPKTLQDTSTAAREYPEVSANIELFNSTTNATSVLLNFLMFCIFCIKHLLILKEFYSKILKYHRSFHQTIG